MLYKMTLTPTLRFPSQLVIPNPFDPGFGRRPGSRWGRPGRFGPGRFRPGRFGGFNQGYNAGFNAGIKGTTVHYRYNPLKLYIGPPPLITSFGRKFDFRLPTP